jgi:hypothetical protein
LPSAPKSRTTWRQKIGLIGIAFLVLLGLLLGAEGLSRIFCPQWAPFQQPRFIFWTYDPLLGWAHRPNQQGPLIYPDFSISVSNNSRGLRDDEYPLERTGKKRMLVLGDSFAWGFGVELPQRFSEILEARHSDWEVINAAVSGYSTDQEYLYLKERGSAFQPDVVLLVMHENDFLGNVESEHTGYYKPCFVVNDGRLELTNVPVPTQKWRQRLEIFILGKTYLFQQIYLGGRTALAKIAARGDPESNDGLRQRQRQITPRLIQALSELCQEKRSKLVIASYALDPEQIECVKSVCASQTIPFLPLDPALVSARQRFTFPNNPHWNATGHRIAADAIDAFLRQQGIFSSSLPAPSLP